MPDKKRILCVGLVCVDLIQLCKEYPVEDSDQRSMDFLWQRGGNAANNCTVLSKLGQQCEYFGTMSEDMMAKLAKQDFEDHSIVTGNVVVHSNCDSPFSSVIINSRNGSRTIIHSNKNMPELKLSDFKRLNLSHYKWVHFEGRNVKEVILMLNHIVEWNKQNNRTSLIRTSVELEKPSDELGDFLALADVVFVGKDFALFQGCKSKHEAVEKYKVLVKPGASVVVAWGECGAAACENGGPEVESRAFLSEQVVDTLGAGDTFVAATVLCLSRGCSLGDSITAGCRVAGAKITAKGFSAVQPALLVNKDIS